MPNLEINQREKERRKEKEMMKMERRRRQIKVLEKTSGNMLKIAAEFFVGYGCLIYSLY